MSEICHFCGKPRITATSETTGCCDGQRSLFREMVEGFNALKLLRPPQRDTIPLEENPLSSLRTCITTHPRDWSIDHGDAWIYGIVVGWAEALGEVASRHGWNAVDTARLERLHDAFERSLRAHKQPFTGC